MQTLLTVLRLPWAKQRLLVETLVILACARLAVVRFPFRWVARVLGKPGAETSPARNAGHIGQIRLVRAALKKTSGHVPWTSKCLDQAVAGKIMLARRGIPATVYLGVKSDERGEIDAHAWLRSGNMYVTGGQLRNGYTVVNTFASFADG